MSKSHSHAYRLPLVALLVFPACMDYSLEGHEPDPPGGEHEAGSPVVLVSPQTVDFGQIAVGESATEVVTVANLGDADLTIQELSLTDSEGPFALSSLEDDRIPPGMEATFVVTWDPMDYGFASGEILVASDDPADPLVAVDLVGDTLMPDLVIEPVSHDFGALDYGVEESVVVTVTNDGLAAAALRDWTYVSSSPEELDVVGALPGELVLEPGESTSVTVRYAPTDDLADEGTLLVSTSSPDQSQISASQSGVGLAPPVYEYEVEMLITADDQWRGWIDGTPISASNQTSWSYSDSLNWTLESGTHVIAIHAEDVASVISGFNSVLWVDGVREYRTGDGVWKMTNTMPASDFIYDTFDDSSWSTAIVCADQSTWGTYWPADFIAEGAEWVWWASSCGDLKEAWFRMVIELP